MKYSLAFFTAAAVIGAAAVCEAAPANAQKAPAQKQISAYDLQMKEIDAAGKAKDFVKRENLARKLLQEKDLSEGQKIRVWYILIDAIRAQKDSQQRAIAACDEFLAAKIGTERDTQSILRRRADALVSIRDGFSRKRDFKNWPIASRVILNDPLVPEDVKLREWFVLADSITYRPASAENSKELFALCDEVAAKKIGDAEFQAGFLRKRGNAFQRIKKLGDAEKIYISIMSDESLGAARVRTDAFYDYINGCMNWTKRNNDPSIQKYGKMLLAVPGIDAGRKANVYGSMLRAATSKDVKELAGTILADPEIQYGLKGDAYRALAWQCVLDRNFAEAEALMEKAITQPKMSGWDMVNTFKKAAEIQIACGNLDKALGICRRLAEYDKSEFAKQQSLVLSAKYCAENGRLDQAVSILKSAGKALDAADLLARADRRAEARKLAMPVLADEQAKPADRKRAYRFFMTIGNDPELKAVRKQYASVYAADGDFDLNHLIARNRTSMLGNALYLGNFDNAVEYFELARLHKSKPAGFDFFSFGVRTYAGYGDCAKAAGLAHEFAANEANKPNDRYTMAVLEAAMLAPNDAKAFAPAFSAVNAKFKDIATPAAQTQAVLWAGRYSLLAKKDNLVEGIEKAYDSLYKPEPRKIMTVPFVDAQISGISDWHALKEKAPAPQLMDRKYGGSMDFLVTDVSTGDRGNAAGGGDAKKQVKPAEFSAICDAQGLHLLFRVYDDRMEEVKAGLLGGGAFEMYLAPGVNQPYVCMLPDLSSGSVGLFQTTYNNEDYTRPTEKNGYKQELKFTEDGSETYIFIPWDPYYSKLPDNGDVYEFENFFWSRNGSFAWNGSKTIHGRSSWGHLKFQLTPDQLRTIRKNQIFKALKNYQAEKRTNARMHGCIDFWRDPVLGDPDFYQKAVAPLVDKLDSYIPLVKPGMTDEEIDQVFTEAVPYWNALRIKLAGLRSKYMLDKLTE